MKINWGDIDVEWTSKFIVVAAFIGSILRWILRPLVRESIRGFMQTELALVKEANETAKKCLANQERLLERFDQIEQTIKDDRKEDLKSINRNADDISSIFQLLNQAGFHSDRRSTTRTPRGDPQ